MKQGTAEELRGLVIREPRTTPLPIRWLKWLGDFFKKKPLGGFGLVIIALIVFVAFAAPLIQRYPPTQVFTVTNPAYDPEIAEKVKDNPFLRLQYPPEKFTKEGKIEPQDPSSAHWLGTDIAGRDLYSRIVNGAARSLEIGLGGAMFVLVSGSLLGVISAYFGGAVDMVIQRFTDALMAFPGLILLLVVVQIFANPSIPVLMFALGIGGVAPIARVVRSLVLTIRNEQYVEAAKVTGASDTRIMLLHVIPQIIPLTMIAIAISIGGLILAESSLSFLGQGNTTAISWGQMVNDGRKLLPAKPSMSVVSGGVIALTVLGFNLVGDALRDVLDPRQRGRSGSGFR